MSCIVTSCINQVSRGVRWLTAIGLGIVVCAGTSLAATLEIPLGQSPKIDGVCDPAGEWKDALPLSYSDAFGSTGTLYLKHDNVNLYVCLQGVSGQYPPRFASVYLDSMNTRNPFAGATDYALHADIISGALSSFKGTDVPNGYTPFALGGWSAATSTGSFDVAEYSIPLALTGGACGSSFGLAAYHHWVTGTGDDYGWPSNHWYDQPQTWTEVKLASLSPCAGKSNLAYVYRIDTAAANDFKALLTAAGFTVDLIPQSAIAATSFLGYDAILIADDTGTLDVWGTLPAQVTAIAGAAKPILGIGEGGYAFFGRLASPIGWPRGWHGPAQYVTAASPLPGSYYANPYDLTGLTDAKIKLYPAPVNEVGIFVPGAPPAGVAVLGWELPAVQGGNPDHAPLINDSCYQLWGFSQSPTQMSEEGRRLFVNAVFYGRAHANCVPPPPPTSCLTIDKVAVPPDGSTVHPGDTIAYTLNYSVSASAQCATLRTLLLDPVPNYSLFVPGSAGPGVVPAFDGTLQWDLGPLAAGATGNHVFKVSVLDTACRPGVVTNTAKLQTNLGTFVSNTTTHKVDCPPVVPPNADPPYAESEIQVYPYPLVAGRSTQLSVQVFNNSLTPQTVTVTFQTSGNHFGLGVPFTTIAVPGNPRTLTIGASGMAEVIVDWTPAFSGQTGIQAKIESPGFAPIYTYRNLDVTEDLHPGVPNPLTFEVVNPTANPATIVLVVVNTCPGWSAVVNPPTIVNAVPGTSYSGTLTVTPPVSGILGTGCHIDVQAWIGDVMIGGIRKLDIPPINLPHSAVPWLEKEISTIPIIPIIGNLNQACVELQNPLGTARDVSVRFSEADFGGGIGFTPFSTQGFTLPPNSIAKYCVPWTPAAGGTLHRCLLVELDQAGWRTQVSQKNLDLERRSPTWVPSDVTIPFSIGNPFPYPGKVKLSGILVGLNDWHVGFTPPPPPDGLDIGVGQMLNMTLSLVPGVQVLAPTTPQVSGVTLSGDVVRADVQVLLNDSPANGFSVEFAPTLDLLSVLSRKVHGGAGTFDLALGALPTDPTTEPRAGGASGSHDVVFVFTIPVISGKATVTESTATAGAPTFSNNEMTVPLTGVANAHYVTVAVSEVASSDGATGGSGSSRIGFLQGDVSANRVVTLADLLMVNAALAQTVGPANFLRDVNASGTLSLADKLLVNSNLTRSLPTP